MEDAKSHGQRVPGMEGDGAVKLVYNFVVQQVADGYIAVTIGADIDKFGGMIRLNRTGAEIMKLLQKETTEEEIVAELKKKYDSEDGTVEKAVHEFVAMLIREKLVA